MTDYPYEGQLIADPVTFQRAVQAAITVYAVSDTNNTTPLALKDLTGLPLANPLTSSADAFIQPFVAPSDGVKLVGAGLTVPVFSPKGIRDAAEASALASQASASSAAAAAGLVGAPADAAIAAAVNGTGATKAALSATYGPTATPMVAAFGSLDARRNIPWPQGLVSFWDFTESAAPFVSKAGMGSFPLIDGGTAVTKTAIDGPFGKLAQLSYTQWLRVPKEQLGALNVGAHSGAVTMGAWVRRDSNTGGTCIAGIWRENGGDEARQYGLWLDLAGYGGDNKAIGHVSKTGGASPGLPYSRDYAASRRQLANDDLRFIAMTYDGTKAIVYIDGVADSYTNYTEPIAPTGEGLTYDKNPYKGPNNVAWDDGLNSALADFTVAVAVPETNTGRGAFKLGGLFVMDRAATQVELMGIHQATKQPATPAIKLDMTLPTSITLGTKYPARLVAHERVRGGGASTTSPDNQTFYSIQASGGKPHLSYDDAVQSANYNVPALAWFDTVKGIPTNQIDKIEFTLNNQLTTTKNRVAIRLNDTWFASNTEFSCSSAHTSAADWSTAEVKTLTINRAMTEWRRLTVTPGSELTLGSAIARTLPLGELTAVGIYTPGSEVGGVIRVTDIKVYATGVLRAAQTFVPDPEPSAAIALTGAYASFDIANFPVGPLTTWTSTDGLKSFVAPTSGKSPIVTLTDEGRRVLRGDGTDDIMDMAWTIGQPHSVVVVGRIRTVATSLPIIASPTTGQVNLTVGNPSTNYALSAGTSLVPSPAVVPDTNRHVWMGVVNGASSVIRIDGTRQVGNAGAQTRTGVRLFASSAAASVQMDIERVYLFDYAITSTEETTFKTQLGF